MRILACLFLAALLAGCLKPLPHEEGADRIEIVCVCEWKGSINDDLGENWVEGYGRERFKTSGYGHLEVWRDTGDYASLHIDQLHVRVFAGDKLLVQKSSGEPYGIVRITL